MNFRVLLLASVFCGVVLEANAVSDKEITIYNQNMALIKESVKKDLRMGVNEVLFEEVSNDIIPQSVLVYGSNIQFIEQNFNANTEAYKDLLKRYVGKQVEVLSINPVTGKKEFSKAKVLSVKEDGKSVLEFDYGVVFDFNGTIVFKDLKENLNDNPILEVKVKANNPGTSKINLAYLTRGFSWNSNYVVNVLDDKNLSLLGRMAIENKSGSDYNDVKVNLIAGDININKERDMMLNGVVVNSLAKARFNTNNLIEEPEELAGNYLYKFPYVTNLKNNEVKQISFI